MSDKPADEPERGFDELLGDLRAVVDQLEGGNLSLDQSLAAYEKGVGLARRGHDLLDQAEKRVERLIRPPSETSDEESVPFDGE